MPRAKKGSISWYTKQLDKEMGQLVRSKGFCERCGRRYDRLEWCHVIGRANKTLRWDIMNALCMDGRCHRFWFHENPLEATEWFAKKFPNRYAYLMRNKNKIVKRTVEDYEQLLDDIKNKRLKKLVTFS